MTDAGGDIVSKSDTGPNPQDISPVTHRGPHRILLIDDNVDAITMLGFVLEAKGFEVITAYDGKSGIAAAAAHRPHIILLDLGMPGMNGFEVLDVLRKSENCAGTLIFAHSGYGLDADKQRAKDAGFDGHFTKPLLFDELDDIIRSRVAC
jgi:CheY-like chemotaxis protein